MAKRIELTKNNADHDGKVLWDHSTYTGGTATLAPSSSRTPLDPKRPPRIYLGPLHHLPQNIVRHDQKRKSIWKHRFQNYLIAVWVAK